MVRRFCRHVSASLCAFDVNWILNRAGWLAPCARTTKIGSWDLWCMQQYKVACSAHFCVASHTKKGTNNTKENALLHLKQQKKESSSRRQTRGASQQNRVYNFNFIFISFFLNLWTNGFVCYGPNFCSHIHEHVTWRHALVVKAK